MSLFDKFKNKVLYSDKYKTHSEAIIIACYFNPQNSPYRLKAFNLFYDTIKHLNHQIIECVIGDSQPQLPENSNIKRVHTSNLLWHKESLLNKLISELPSKYKYIFWLDADVLFTNNDWLIDSVAVLKEKNIVQPFEYCVHMNRDEIKPKFSTGAYEHTMAFPSRHPSMWRSFCANYVTTHYSDDTNYDKHGHVGFAWGARREVLEAVPLYDKALIGGADHIVAHAAAGHIVAHAAAGHICHACIAKSFTENLDEINEWSEKFYQVVKGKIGYVKGTLYHIWHGDVEKRQYLKRIQDFTPKNKHITKKDKHGLYVTNDGKDDVYVKEYFNHREVKPTANKENTSKAVYYEKRAELVAQYPNSDDSFIDSMIWGYITDSTMMGTAMGGNVLGAMVGDMLNNNDQQVLDNVDMNFVPNNDMIQSDSTQVNNGSPISDNFS